jgi:predicted TIM-barrel fold metal-dependent hydrolase
MEQEMTRTLIVSADTHAGLPLEGYRDWLDPRYRKVFDEGLDAELAERNAERAIFFDEDFKAEWVQGRVETGMKGAWDSDERIRQMDLDGVAAEVIYPDGITENNAPPFQAGFALPSEGVDPELQWAGSRAHNRWLAEFCSAVPERRAGLAVVPILYDIDEAIREIEWAAKQGLRGILIPALTGPYAAYNSPRYEPIWSACVDHELILHIHGGAAPYYGGFTNPESEFNTPGMTEIYITEFAWWAYRPVWFLILGGVFERHPALRLVVSEFSTSFVPMMKGFMDGRFADVIVGGHGTAKLGPYRGPLKMKPSEYFDRNVWVSGPFRSVHEVAERHAIGLGNTMWGHDFPHPEGLWPETDDFLKKTFRDVPDDERRMILGETAADLYGFDRRVLEPIAACIGPDQAFWSGDA